MPLGTCAASSYPLEGNRNGEMQKKKERKKTSQHERKERTARNGERARSQHHAMGEKAQSWHDRTTIQRTRDGVEKGSWQNGEKNVLEVKEKPPLPSILERNNELMWLSAVRGNGSRAQGRHGEELQEGTIPSRPSLTRGRKMWYSDRRVLCGPLEGLRTAARITEC